MKLNRDEAVDYIKDHLEDYLRGKGIDPKKEFSCLNPAHNDKHPSMGIVKKSGDRVTCASCKATYDTLDLIGLEYNLTDYNAKIAKGCELYHIEIEKGNHHYRRKESDQKADTPTDYTSYFEERSKHLSETDYPQRRGLSSEICARFKLGYDPQWQSPAALKKWKAGEGKEPPKTARLIIPTSKYTYIARDVRPDSELKTDNEQRYKKMKEGEAHPFNLDALKQDQPVIIVEGEIDALSIMDVGGNALALGGVNYKPILSAVDEKKPEQPLIVALDNDSTGISKAAELEAALKQRGIKAMRANLFEGFKDANEMLQHDREKLREAVAGVTDSEREQRREYMASRASAHLAEFLDGISDSVNTLCYTTGFRNLDKVLDGGLYEGLYTIGAMTSLGKTTFVMQMADAIAQNGNDVLIIALEMARSELMAKSLSRHTVQLAMERGISTANAKTARGITDGKRWEKYNQTERGLIEAAATAYEAYADHIYIHEGIGDIGIARIRDLVERHIRYTGNRPLLIIDYMQILPPADVRATDKQNTDTAVLEMKRLSRDKKIPVIAISSFNRTGYNQDANFSQLKESGAIEYGSDVVLSLQLRGAGEKGFNPTELKKLDPRPIELVVLKNRQGKVGDKVEYRYYPKFNYFIEGEIKE